MSKIEDITTELTQEIEKIVRENAIEFQEILKHFPTELSLTQKGVTFEDINNRAMDSSYLPFSYEVTKEGLIFLLGTPEILRLLQNESFNTVKKLTISSRFLGSVKDVEKFPEVEELNIKDYCRLSKEELDFISQYTKIKKITTSSLFETSREIEGEENTITVSLPKQKIQYKNILLEEPKSDYNTRSLSITIHNSRNLKELKTFLKRLNISMDDLSEIYLNDQSTKDRFSYPLAKFHMENGKINQIDIMTEDYQTIEDLLKEIKEENLSPTKISLRLENRSDKKLSRIEKIAGNLPIEINYGAAVSTTLDNFSSMRASLDWYKSLVEGENLSPLEKTLYLYDIVKSFSYRESTENKKDARYIPEIMQTGNIVCVGYTALLKELLQEESIPAIGFSVTIKNEDYESYHQRLLVNLEDMKYNIHGIFSLDATWDSNKGPIYSIKNEEGEEVLTYHPKKTEHPEKIYDSLSLYQNFLVPYTDYEIQYPNNTKPYIFWQLDYKNNQTTEEPPSYMVKIEAEQLIPDGTIQQAIKIATESKRPSLEILREALKIVREKEGYNPSTVNEVVEDTLEINEKLADKEGTKFFSPTITQETAKTIN